MNDSSKDNLKFSTLIVVLLVICVGCLTMMSEDESDGAGPTYMYYFYDHGDLVGRCASDNVTVPDPTPHDGERFIGWSTGGEIVDPHTYTPTGATSFYAQYAHVEDEPSDEGELVLLAGVVIAIISLLAVCYYIFR